MPASTCTSCERPIWWAFTPTGAKMPVDYTPLAEGGNVLLQRPSALGGELLAVTLSGNLLTRLTAEHHPLFRSHWASCVNREQHRAETDAKRAREVVGDG